MQDIFILLVLFQIKHFLCDYPLRNSYMLGKFKREMWQTPLLAHTGVHAIGTFIISLIFTGNIAISYLLGVSDLIIHFIVDRIKAHPDLGGKYSQDNPKFWWCLGADQMAHHLTHYVIIYFIIQFINGQ